MRRIAGLAVILFTLFAAGGAQAQENPAPPKLCPREGIDPAGEIDKLKGSCSEFQRDRQAVPKSWLTGQPVHIAVGSIAPQNGFGAGIAYLGHKTTENWRINWDSDAVGSINGSWRAGLYIKFVDTHEKPVGGHFGTKGRKTRVLFRNSRSIRFSISMRRRSH